MLDNYAQRAEQLVVELPRKRQLPFGRLFMRHLDYDSGWRMAEQPQILAQHVASWQVQGVVISQALIMLASALGGREVMYVLRCITERHVL